MSFNDDDRINEQFENLNKTPTSTVSPQADYHNKHFDITDKIIDKIDNNKFLIKITFREFMVYADAIRFQRQFEESKIDELYTSIVDGYTIPFTIDAIYDKTCEFGDNNIKIINGNHRHKAVCKYITDHDDRFNCEYKVYIWIYVVDDCEDTNSKQSIELYKKINNHLPFKEPINIDITDRAQKFCNKLCSTETKRNFPFLKGIRKTVRGETCHQPNINIHEISKLLIINNEIIERFLSKYSDYENNLIITENILNDFVKNIKIINHQLFLKKYDGLYSGNKLAENRIYFDKAVEIGFFLNQKNSKYPKEEWIKFLCDPTKI